jgi:hypothetical protein
MVLVLLGYMTVDHATAPSQNVACPWGCNYQEERNSMHRIAMYCGYKFTVLLCDAMFCDADPQLCIVAALIFWYINSLETKG